MFPPIKEEARAMSQEPNGTADMDTDLETDTPTVDLIRWTFTSDPAHRAAIEEHLTDLGLDVLVRDGCKFLVTWDEPDGDGEEIITEIWALNGVPFEVTQEGFQRLGLHILHHVEDEGGEITDAA
jgi:hypothetical protein